MPRVSEMSESKYMKAGDLSEPGGGWRAVVVTVARDVWEETFKNGDKLWCIKFQELVKPLGLNATNRKSIASILQQDDTANWIGGKVELYVKPDVEFNGETIPAIRIRKPSAGSVAAKSQYATPAAVPGSIGPEIAEKAKAMLVRVQRTESDLRWYLGTKGMTGLDFHMEHWPQSVVSHVGEFSKANPVPKLPEGELDDSDIPF